MRRAALGAATGFVVSDVMAAVLVVLAVAGVLLDRPLLSALGTLVLAITVLARWWSRVALEGVRYTLEVAPARAVAGDRITLTLTLENHKRIPVPWLRVHEAIPHGLALADSRARHGGAFGASFLVATTSLGAHERVRLHYRLDARARGHYVLGPGRLVGGDPFGLYESQRVVVRATATLVVYPDVPESGPVVWRPQRPVGDHRTALRLLDDPSRPMSVREYRPGDDARGMDWKVTARRGAPWVRVNEASAATAVVLAVDCDTRRHGAFDHDPDRLERVVRASAALARDLLRAGQPVGLVANGVPPADRARVAVAPGSAPGQYTALLESLARVQPLVVKPLSVLLAEHAPRLLPAGSSVVWVCASGHADAVACLAARARRGERAALLYVGDGDAPVIPGVHVVTWREGDCTAGDARGAGGDGARAA